MIVTEIPWLDPMTAAANLSVRPRLAFLDSAMAHPSLGRWSYAAADPFGVFQVRGATAFWNETALDEAPVPALRACLARYHRPARAGGPPFQGGAIGFFAYEAGRLFERLPATRPLDPGLPTIDLAFYDTLLAFDAVERRAYAIAPDERAARLLRARAASEAPRRTAPSGLVWQDNCSRAGYEAKVAAVIDYIRGGDIFQANLAHRFSAALPQRPDAVATYRTLRQANPAPFAALLVDGERFIASSSPERFLRLAGGRVETRPIKGTIRRSAERREDAALAAALAASEKDRAENVMIVDLLRNDLSRVCRPGSVKVPSLCGVETYASVHHLTSVVTGELASGRDIVDLIGATFPGGSITGAPKIRAMEIIAELEGEDRGVYCGAIGAIGFDGSADLNIAIRTLTCDGESLTVNAGGGITLLSEPAAEYEETLVKAERMLGAFGGLRRTDAAA